MPPARKKRAKSEPEHGHGLSFDTLSRIGAQFGVPVLAGISKAAVEDLPTNTIFMSVADQHWLLGMKGVNKTLIFDSLGLPPTALQHICRGVPIMPWNKFGYQSMFSSVCGYYLISAIISVQHGELVHNADIDRLFNHICPYRVPRPDNMTEWYSLHRHYNEQLKQNDQRVTEYVGHTYPHLAWIDHHAPSLKSGENSSGTLGSPLYAHAGIHAPTVHQRYGNISMAMNNDPQRAWPGIGEALISSMPDKPRVINGNRLAYEVGVREVGDRLRQAQQQIREDRARQFHVAGPDLRRPLTHDERTLWARAGMNAYNPPSGPRAAQAAVEPPARAENAANDDDPGALNEAVDQEHPPEAAAGNAEGPHVDLEAMRAEIEANGRNALLEEQDMVRRQRTFARQQRAQHGERIDQLAAQAAIERNRGMADRLRERARAEREERERRINEAAGGENREIGEYLANEAETQAREAEARREQRRLPRDFFQFEDRYAGLIQQIREAQDEAPAIPRPVEHVIDGRSHYFHRVQENAYRTLRRELPTAMASEDIASYVRRLFPARQ